MRRSGWAGSWCGQRGLGQSRVLHSKELLWARSWGWPRQESSTAARGVLGDHATAPEGPPEMIRVERAMLKTGFCQDIGVRYSHGSPALLKDKSPIRLEMTRMQQSEIVRKTYFQILPVIQQLEDTEIFHFHHSEPGMDYTSSSPIHYPVKTNEVIFSFLSQDFSPIHCLRIGTDCSISGISFLCRVWIIF